MTRNPNRTTKPERRRIRRRNPTMSRILGVAQAARWHRDGFLLDEAKAFETMAADVLYGRPPGDLGDRVMRVLEVTPNYTEAMGNAIYDVDVDGSATLHDCTIAPCGWTQPRAGADPRDWYDLNEADALRAEAIERELNDDIDPGD